jgi:hypothetical protein
MHKIQDGVAATIDITTDTTWEGVIINQGDVVNVSSGATLTMAGSNTHNHGGTINVNSGGTILVTGGLISGLGAILNINSGGRLTASGNTFINDHDATINVNSGGVFRYYTSPSLPPLSSSSGHISVNAGGILEISGQLVNNGEFRQGILNVNSGGLLIVDESGILHNTGTLNVNPGGEVIDLGDILVLGMSCEGCPIGRVNVMADGRLFVMSRGELIANLGGIYIHGIVSLSGNAHLALGGGRSSLAVEPGGTLRVGDAGVVIVGPGTDLHVRRNGLFQCTSDTTVQGGELIVYDDANLNIGTEVLRRGLLFLTQAGVVRIHGTAIVHDGSRLNMTSAAPSLSTLLAR